MERKTLSNNIPGLTMPGTADWALETTSSGDVVIPRYLENISVGAFSKNNSPVGTIGAMGNGNMPVRIVPAKKQTPSYSSVILPRIKSTPKLSLDCLNPLALIRIWHFVHRFQDTEYR